MISGIPLWLVGFGTSGPITGSLAALWQAYIGKVTAGNLFATLQAWAMVGAPVAVGVALLLAVLSGVTGVAVAAVELVRG
ncbi:hypothetical protein FPQ18DRAFT_384823 [Pyronema domesticum]|uniref:Similar to similar to An08g11220 [Aspergillus kawachii IFO 4308] acc. no. GAA93195 n=1 Tax=Pyronema omphalodes (strain CBS 100304) TaxID=1076935 RepID=U4L137_PYROM|nr:hypothetical protein FPQ18DRAFT_384823 [Pyronema domesticum]CCX08602.1 Similar to similar to An08g11220 [Aspergillus kawachii IFO 4308]; acc. no. GAA93195 [Pyronema omphalodes CBS 100304]